MNKKLLKYCLIVIAICFVGSLSLLYVTDLKEPVFLEHYYELMAHDNAYFELSYITNYYDDAELIYVSFPQLEGTNVLVAYSEMASYSSDSYSRYKMQTVRVSIKLESSEYFDDIMLDNAEIRLTNDKSVTGYIGKIVLFSDNADQSVKLVDTFLSSSSNTGVSFSDARFLDDVSVNSLPFVLKTETDGILKLFVNNLSENDVPDFSQNKLEIASSEIYNEAKIAAFTDDSRVLDESSLPFSFYKDEYVLMVSELIIDDSDVRKYNRYDIHRRIYLENAQGEIEYRVLYNMNYQPYLSGMEIYKFLEYKEGK